MVKALTSLSLIALLITGCTSLHSSPVTPSPNAEASRPQASSIPTVHLESAGSTVQGLETVSQWVEPNGMSGSGGMTPLANPPAFPGEIDVKAGQSLEIVVTANSLVPSLVVTELDMLGVPTISSVLKPTTSATPYLPHAVGHFVLQVTVQQSWQQYMTYLFEVNVKS